MTAGWILLALLAAYAIGRQRGWVKGRRHGIAEGRATCNLCRYWEEMAGAREADLLDQLATADRTIADLNHNIGVVWDAGFYHGQVVQADREANGL